MIKLELKYTKNVTTSHATQNNNLSNTLLDAYKNYLPGKLGAEAGDPGPALVVASTSTV